MSTQAERIIKTEIDQRGLCHETKYSGFWDLFFAETALERRPARNLCGSCPVREQCLRWALEHKEIWGIWGGCDESEIRRALWVNANGHAVARSRFPHCPYCKARPNKLYVVASCDTATTTASEHVECTGCGFSWKAATSVSAVKSYWRDRSRQLKAKKIRTRMQIRQARTDKRLRSLSPVVSEVSTIVSLAASAESA